MKNKTKQHEVFFVDDDSEVRSAVAEDLEDLGCKVSCFASAADCLEQLLSLNVFHQVRIGPGGNRLSNAVGVYCQQ